MRDAHGETEADFRETNRKGGDINIQSKKEVGGIPEGSTPLMMAVVGRREDKIRALLALGADPSIRNGKGNALKQAKTKRVAKMLIEAGIFKALTKEELREVLGMERFGPEIRDLTQKELLRRTVKALQKGPSLEI